MKSSLNVTVYPESMTRTRYTEMYIMQRCMDAVTRELDKMNLEFDCGFNPQEIIIAEC